MGAHNRRAHSGLLLGLVHRFWRILGGILAGFIICRHLGDDFLKRFQFGDLFHPEPLEIRR